MNHDQMISDTGRLFVQFKQGIGGVLPSLVGALAIFLIGLLMAYFLRAIVRRLIRGLDRFIPSNRIQNSLRRIGMERPAAEVISGILYWIVIIFFLTAATETLGLPVITTWLNGIAMYLPRILGAVLIGFAGLAGGILLRDAVAAAALSAGIAYGDMLGKMVQFIILLITALIGIEHIGVNTSILSSVLTVLIGAGLFGAALAFGLGARTAISNILASHYIQQVYHPGQIIRVGEIRGRIIRITPTYVILETQEGQALVPASTFSERDSILLTKEDLV
ncbi:MAG: mechanosensitive ion channel [bacterium]|nr:mechanosensitive ion channel [bacterium]